MGASLAVNPAAVLMNRRHPNAQYLADGATTLGRSNQSDEGNFPGSEPVFFAVTGIRRASSSSIVFCLMPKSSMAMPWL
jgi:hypothetical protein